MKSKSDAPYRKTESFIYGNMDWWDVAEQPDNFDMLPVDFAKAFQLWERNPETNFSKISNLLTPYLYGLFVAENLMDYEEVFSRQGFAEFPHCRLLLSGVDYAEGPLPRVKTEAVFKVSCSQDIEHFDLEQWLEENGGYLSDCVSFGWNIPDVEVLDLTFGDNQGVEAFFVQSEDFIKP